MSKCPECGKEEDGFCGRMKCARWEVFKKSQGNPKPPEPLISDEEAAVVCAILAATCHGS